MAKSRSLDGHAGLTRASRAATLRYPLRRSCLSLVVCWVAQDRYSPLQRVRTAHLDEERQCPTLHDLPLVVFILEGQRTERSCTSTLNFDVPRLKQGHQRGDAALVTHAVLEGR